MSRRFGLRAQILVSLIVLMAATLMLISVAMFGVTHRGLERQAELSAQRVAQVASGTIASALDPSLPLDAARNTANVGRLCELFARQFDGARMTVVGPLDGSAPLRVWGAYPRAAEPIDGVMYLAARDGRLHTRVNAAADGLRQAEVFAPVRQGDRVVAALRIEMPLGHVQEALATSQQLVLLYLGIDALFIVVFGYFVLTRLIVRPLLAISAATDRVASGDLNTTVEVRARNEIGELAANFERMVGRLRTGRDTLERRVEELAESKAALERAQGELVFSEKMATVGGLAAGIAHEIGNPLAAVVGLVELLSERDGMSEETVDDLVARVDREIARIHGTISELLDYARVSDGAVELVDVAHPVEAAMGLLAHHPKGRGVSVDVDGASGLLVRANENRVVQVLLNLFLNAADAMAGSGTVRVACASRAREDVAGVEIRVADEGPGIAVEAMDSLFEPFFTTKAAGDGTGLGLAMSQRIVRAFGGEITAENAAEGGAVFTVWLPSEDPASRAEPGTDGAPGPETRAGLRS